MSFLGLLKSTDEKPRDYSGFPTITIGNDIVVIQDKLMVDELGDPLRDVVMLSPLMFAMHPEVSIEMKARIENAMVAWLN